MSVYFQKLSSPVGNLFLVDKGGSLGAIVYEHNWIRYCDRLRSAPTELETPVLQETRTQLTEYFAGTRQEFSLPYVFEGSPFQVRVWEALSKVPFGETRSYKEQAELIDNPKAIRAVGRTNGLNTLNIVVPCHRVIGSNGSLTGYGGDLKRRSFCSTLKRVESDRRRLACICRLQHDATYFRGICAGETPAVRKPDQR